MWVKVLFCLSELKLSSSFNSNIQKILLIKPKIEIILKAYELKKTERKYLDYDDIIQVVASRLNKDENVKRVIG